MKRFIIPFACAMLLCLSTAAFASLDSFMANINIQAQADLPGFKTKISAQFGVPVSRVEEVFVRVSAPADLFMTFQLGQMSGKPSEVVLQSYKANKGKGWGVIAKDLGIKPGSAEFHALKRGDLQFTGRPAGGGDEPARGKGKGKGHNK
jgi:hypothetical protein